MENALRGDKISHIYFIVRLILTCIGTVIMGIGLFILGLRLSLVSDGFVGDILGGWGILFGTIGFFILVYCAIIFAIGLAYNLVPILIGASMKEKFLKTNNPKFIRDSLLLKGIFLGFGITSSFSLIFNAVSNEAYFLVIGCVMLLIADIVISIFTWLGYSDACRAFKQYKNWQYSQQNMNNGSPFGFNQTYSQGQPMQPTQGMEQYNEKFEIKSEDYYNNQPHVDLTKLEK